MGEIGIPFDLDHRDAYSTGDYHNQARALDASLNACDGGNVLNYSIWCYVPDNVHEWGDLWNGEDLSIYSRDDAMRKRNVRKNMPYRTFSSSYAYRASGISPAITFDTLNQSESSAASKTPRRVNFANSSASLSTNLNPSSVSLPDNEDDVNPEPETVTYVEINDGARALPAFVRPYPVATVGRPTSIDFDLRSSEFTLTVEVQYDDLSPNAPEILATEIFMPLVHYAAAPQAISQAVREDLDMPHTVQRQPGRKKSPISADGSDEAISEEGDEDVNSLKPLATRGSIIPHISPPPGALDLAIDVSAGSWTVQDQILYWHYPRPADASEGTFTYTLRARRGSGPIGTWAKQYGSPQSEPWQNWVSILSHVAF